MIVGGSGQDVFVIQRIVGVFALYRRIIGLAFGKSNGLPRPFPFAGFLIFAKGVGYEISHRLSSRMFTINHAAN